MLSANAIRKTLGARILGAKIIIRQTIGSTNALASEFIKSAKAEDGTVILAEQQTCGKGRRQNKWQSQTGEAILCSVVIKKNKIAGELLAVATAVAVGETIDAFCKKKTMLKWPNDVFVNDKKIAGILIEVCGDFFITGIGINCHQGNEDLAVIKDQPATSIDLNSQNRCDRNIVIAKLLGNLEKYLSEENENRQITEMWNKKNLLLGKRIVVEQNGKQFAGSCLAIEPLQGLVLQLDVGGVRIFDAGTTTIVK